MRTVPIKGFEDTYTISEEGYIYNIKYNRFIKTWKNKKGYVRVELWKGNKRYKWYIHRLVALHFIEYNTTLVVDHIDMNKSNNHYSNLRFCTVEDNNRYYMESDKYKEYLRLIRSGTPMGVLSE